MTEQERPGRAPAAATEPVQPPEASAGAGAAGVAATAGTASRTGRRGWWRSTAQPPRPAGTRAPRSTGIVELRDVARKGKPDDRAARIGCDASEHPEMGSDPGASPVPGGEAPRRRLRWLGWISRRVIHDRAGL